MKRITAGVKFAPTGLLAALRQVLRRRHLAALSLGEQDVLLRAVTRDWEESAKIPLVEWVSSKSQDDTEIALTCAANWDVSERFRISVTGSTMVVVARFWARTYEDALRVHYTINGWGEPKPDGRITSNRRKLK